MQTYLISSSSKDFITQQIRSITKNLSVKPENYIEVIPDNSLKIEDVRKITRGTSLKPMGGGDRIIVIQQIEKATLEAGNALLKILEEPPENNYFILVTDNFNKLLPTIISRCQIISDDKKNDVLSNKDKSREILRDVLAASIGERILISQKIATSREEGLKLLDDLIIVLEELLFVNDPQIQLSPSETGKLLKKVSAARIYLERYVNFKATIDVLFLGFPHINK